VGLPGARPNLPLLLRPPHLFGSVAPHPQPPRAGVATALKVLFASKDCDGAAPASGSAFADLTLERNEAIALLNLLARFSNSVHLYHELSARLEVEEGAAPALKAGAAVS
jgi:hypothetical protein